MARRDPIRAALDARGVSSRDFHDDDERGRPVLGPLINISHSEIVYRLVEPNEMLVILYRRLDQQRALANPFADLIAFLLLATEPEFGLRRVLTNPIPFDPDDTAAPASAKLARAYVHLFEAEWVDYDGCQWLARDAASLHQRMLQLRHKATPLPPRSSVERPHQVMNTLLPAVAKSSAGHPIGQAVAT